MKTDTDQQQLRQQLEVALAAFMVENIGQKESDAARLSVDFIESCMQRFEGQRTEWTRGLGWHFTSQDSSISFEVKPYAGKRIAERFGVSYLHVCLVEARARKLAQSNAG